MFTTPDLIDILNTMVDEAERIQLSPDQATVLAVRQSLVALVTVMVEQYKIQGQGVSFEISPMFIHGLIDVGLWMGDRLDLSLLGNEIGGA